MNEILMLLIFFYLGLAMYLKRKALETEEKEKKIVGIIVFVIIGFIGVFFIIDLIDQIMETRTFIKQFPSSFAEDLYRDFGHLEKQYEEVSPYIKGKAIVIEIRTKREFLIFGREIVKPKISSINLDLLRRGFPIAQSASEVNTIIFLRYYNVLVGRYVKVTGRPVSNAYRIDVDITIVDKAKGAVVGTKTIYGSDPPPTISHVSDGYGEEPSNEEIIKYLLKSLKK